ncbi:hypothetical protein D6C90_01517 [Aureobasidium pullulans]|uniref:Apple domain-containing protein n=1 Tax=Aureobasidium pullulans TaxID=5580 RepID=A0A4S9VID2_AURPU|nr:hypothetical protein D6C90_01517 [Aureobasidium pullulans]
MRPYSAFLAIGFAVLVSGQTPGSDGQITVATATCTAIGTQTYAVTDAQGILYRYQCGAGTFGNQFSAVPSSSVGNWTACFAFCDNAPGCSGFTYVNGAPNGNGPGGCNLKSGTAQSLNSDGLVSTRIGAIMARYGPKPAPTNSCPAQNLQTITDFNGVNYVIACGNDTNGNGVTALGANYGFNECFDKCDSYTASTSPSVCNAFQWVGTGANGVGGGNCYLKFVSTASFVTAYNTNNVGAIRVVVATPTIASSASSSSSSSSSSVSSSLSSSSSSSVSSSLSSSSSSSFSSFSSSSASSVLAAPASSAAPSTPTPTPTLLGCPQGDGSTFTDSSGIQYLIRCDKAFTGYTDQQYSAPDLSSCLPICSADPQCRAAIYEDVLEPHWRLLQNVLMQ